MANGFKLGESLSPPSLSPNKVLITNNAGKAETSAITTSELNALSGIQGNIQQQINNIGGVSIDDTAASTTSVYSSSKVMSELDALTATLLDRFYPVGCVVITFQEMEDQDLIARYGGTTWQRIQDRYLVAAGSNHTVNTTGGSSTVTLTTDNLPSHSHSYVNTIVGSTTLTTSQMPSHTHTPYNSGTEKRIVSSGIGYGSANISVGGDAFASTTLNSTGGSGSHTHPDTSQSKTTGNTGSGTAFSIEPPYIAIYMWRRTA